MELTKHIDLNYNYISIFTNFDGLEYSDLRRNNLSLVNEGYSGNWVISQTRDIEKVILYVRENGINKIYIADYNYRENIEERRSRVYCHNPLVKTMHFKCKALASTNVLKVRMAI